MAEYEQKNLQFTISQLRQDKIIYAVEACATNLICLVGLFFSSQYFHGVFRNVVDVLLVVVAVGYTLFMGIGNFYRLQKIISLQKRL